VHCTQISPEFESRSKVKVTRDKKREKKTAEPSPLTMHSKACADCAVGGMQQSATYDTIAWTPGGDGLRRWENERMLSSLFVSLFVCSHDNFRTIQRRKIKLSN